MKTLRVLPIVIASLVLASAAAPACAQATFTVPFKFESGAKKLAAGAYLVSKTGEAELTFKQVATGKETVLPFTEKLDPGDQPSTGPRIVFDEVGNFEPSYTEYFTVYVVAEVWLTPRDGYLVHLTRGAHKNKVVNGEAAKK